jgi:hypothetical protein
MVTTSKMGSIIMISTDSTHGETIKWSQQNFEKVQTRIGHFEYTGSNYVIAYKSDVIL